MSRKKRRPEILYTNQASERSDLKINFSRVPGYQGLRRRFHRRREGGGESLEAARTTDGSGGVANGVTTTHAIGEKIGWFCCVKRWWQTLVCCTVGNHRQSEKISPEWSGV